MGFLEKPTEVFAVDREERKWGGRPRKMTDEQVSVALRLYYEEGMAVREVADAVNVSHMTVWRAISRVSPDEAFNYLALGIR